MKAVNVLFATFSSSLAAMAPAITGASDDDPWARFRDLAKNDEDSNLPDLCGGCHCIPALKKKKKKSKTNTMAPQKPAKRKKCPKKKKVPVTDYPPEVVQILRDQTMNTFLGSDVQVPCVPTSLPPALGPLADQLPKCSDLLIDGGDDAVCGLNYDYSALPEECGSKSRGSRSKSRASSTFDDIDEGCCPASYDLKTYINKKEAKKDDAFITHEGSCGQCSTAKDLAAYIDAGNDLPAKVSNCFFQNADLTGNVPPDFEVIKNCIIGTTGFTNGCATAWTIDIFITLTACSEPCLAAFSGMIPNNGPAPDCPLNDCLQCNELIAMPAFLEGARRTRRNSGLLSEVARPCESIARITHNPCP
mmetsp:Transcript_53994/g.161619  ORF Transcript_53994/g.161619 Transcript_53994/m.161619 type:complete len:361 (-) Transcript_53994:209-1291(-)